VARITGVETVEPVKILSVVDGLATVAVGPTQLVAVAEGIQTGNAYISIRAEEVLLEKGSSETTSARNRLMGEIRTLTREGPMVRVGLDCGFVLTALITRQAYQELDLHEGDRVSALIKAPAVHLIPRD
jgi:molybdate transport system ATP-binding protein